MSLIQTFHLYSQSWARNVVLPPEKVRLFLTCPHLSGQGLADGEVVHGEAEAGPGDAQLHPVPRPITQDHVVLVHHHLPAVRVELASYH